jgi:GT2 family glycosyltransferase
MRFSIIIPAPRVTDWLREAMPYYERLGERDFEIIFVPDEPCDPPAPGVKVIASGKCGPALKRDLAAKEACGEILAFIDDDAYPEPDWLTVAGPAFGDRAVAAVGGPAMTPDSDTFWQRAGGASFLSVLGGGYPERYWPVGPERDVDDWPTVNFLVRRDVFLALGGFDTRYWPGEDTIFCLKLLEAGHRIRYVPSAKVWHHRRVDLRAHLRQVGNYGYHRGHFARVHPRNSSSPKYFAPTALVLWIASGLAALKYAGWGLIWGAGMVAYGGALLVAFVQILSRTRHPGIALGAVPFILLGHLAYGVRFMAGYFAPTIDRNRK